MCNFETTMNSKILLLLIALIFCSTSVSIAQDSLKQKSIIVKKGRRTFDITKYNVAFIVQNVTRNGVDSIRLKIDADSLIKCGDTLIVRPWYINEERFVNDSKPSRKSTSYDNVLNNIIKIPTKEIEKIKIKRQPFCIIMTSIATISYLGAITTIFAIPPNSEEQINKRTNITMGFFYVFIPSFTTRLIFGKKRLHFDKNRTALKTWQF